MTRVLDAEGREIVVGSRVERAFARKTGGITGIVTGGQRQVDVTWITRRGPALSTFPTERVRFFGSTRRCPYLLLETKGSTDEQPD
jgi:hypothetical protein